VRMETFGEEQPVGAGAAGGAAWGGRGICEGPPVVMGGGTTGGFCIRDGPPVPTVGAGITGGGGMGELTEEVCVWNSTSV
jgi:hypothetical protein